MTNSLVTLPSLAEILADLSAKDLTSRLSLFDLKPIIEEKPNEVITASKSLVVFEGIKLFHDEEVLEVQRQHIVTLLMPFLLVATFLISGLSLLFYFYNSNYVMEFYLPSVLVSAGAFISFIQLFTIYIFMSWFYQFYIITNKRLIHICFFRVGGFHLDEVFHQHTTPLEIDRHPQNFIFDLLGIEDLYIYFQRFERPEPFIFKTPKDHIKLGELLESHSLKRGIRER